MEETGYRAMYLHLFRAVTEAIGACEQGRIEGAKGILMEAQRHTEEMFIKAGESEKNN
jgi:hypothetical protein